MQYSQLPRVHNGALRLMGSPVHEEASVPVGSGEWYALLEQIASFGFEDQRGGSFTARRERRDQQWYWYAYRKHGKKLHKVYLGKTEQLESARLLTAARELAELPGQLQPSASVEAHFSPASQSSAESTADTFLRSTKLRMPATPANLLHRPRLTQQIRHSSQESAAVTPNQHHSHMRLTVITAPAGYGKSTLLSEWLQQVSDLDIAWLSLDHEDNDTAQFWRYVITALQASRPELGRLALRLLQEPQTSTLDGALTALLNDLQRAPRGMVLVLDDYHVIDAPAVHDSLAMFLSHSPACLHVVISSQTRPPLPFGRLRLHSDVTELVAADLRLTEEEGRALLSRDPRLASNPQAIATVLSKTEGWFAGVNLFLLALQRRGNLEMALAEFDGSNHYLAEYFFESVWHLQNPAIRAFLLNTAILENFNGSFCEAVTGLANGQQIIARIEQANLFLVALDQRPGWYRYHPLFAQALRGMLEQVYPEEVPSLHRRAAVWCLEHHAIDDVLHHFVAGQLWVEAAQVLEQYAFSMLQGGNVAQLLRWLGQLPRNILHKFPALTVLKARALVLAGELNALEAWLEYLKASSAPATVLDEIARIRMLIGTNGDAAVAADTTWESFDAFTISMQHWSRGDMQASYAAAERAFQVGQTSGLRAASLLGLGTQAMLHIVRGELRAALRVAQQGFALEHTTEAAILAGAHRPNPAAAPILLALGVVYYERNRLHLAQQCLEKALELAVQLGRADYLFAAHALLARTLGACGQRHAAQSLMQTGVTRAREGRISFWSEADILAYQAWNWLQQGEMSLASRWAQTADVWMGDSQIAKRSIEYWVYAELLLAQGQYEQAAFILGQLVQNTAQTATRVEPLIKLLIAYASALFAQGQRQAALPVLERALGLGYAEGYVRPFLDGVPRHSRALLEYYYQKTRPEQHIEAYVQQLLAEDERATAHGMVSADGRKPAITLSQREQEILRLVEGGLSNPEIAHKLVIEANTVKSHLHRIYQRLSVSTRYQAVKHAKALQLL